MARSSTTPRTTPKAISRDDLTHMIDRQIVFTLIEVLDAQNFAEFHLPGAINIPFNDHFDTAVVNAVPDKNHKVVLYCGDKTCDASAKAARELLAMGYTRVRFFEEGKQGWRDTPPTGPARPAVRSAN